MENETRTLTDCEQGSHRWTKLYGRVKNGGTKRMCNKCGAMEVMARDGWELVERTPSAWEK